MKLPRSYLFVPKMGSDGAKLNKKRTITWVLSSFLFWIFGWRAAFFAGGAVFFGFGVVEGYFFHVRVFAAADSVVGVGACSGVVDYHYVGLVGVCGCFGVGCCLGLRRGGDWGGGWWGRGTGGQEDEECEEFYQGVFFHFSIPFNLCVVIYITIKVTVNGYINILY